MSVEKVQQQEKFRRIYKQDEDRLMAVVNQMTTVSEADSEAAIKDKQRRAKRIAEFYERYPRGEASRRVHKTPKRLCYENIGEFIAAAGLSYKALLEITGGSDGSKAKLEWPNKIERIMCSYCDSLSDEDRDKVLALVKGLVPKSIMDIVESDAVVAVKVFDIAEARKMEIGPLGGKLKDDYMLNNVYTYCHDAKKSCDTIPFYAANRISALADTSYHFMLGLDENDCILAKNGKTETIMDYFCLLPLIWKEHVLAAVKEYASRKKGAVSAV